MTEAERNIAQAEIARADREDAAVLAAAQQPLAGPARKAFALAQSIAVGPYTVRAACDWDLKLLSQLQNRAYEFFVEGKHKDNLVLRRDEAWELCWILTRPVEQIVAMVEGAGGIDSLKREAEKEFSRYAGADVDAVTVACFEQLEASLLPMPPDAYNPRMQANGGQPEGVAKRAPNPTSATGGPVG